MQNQTTETNRTPAMSRRKALARPGPARLGLAAGVAYAVPTIVRLDRSANAKVLPTPCPPPGGGGKGGKCK